MSGPPPATPSAEPRPALWIVERALDLVDNPLLLKELRGAFRRRRYLYLLIALLTLVGVSLLISVYAIGRSSRDPGEVGRKAFLTFYALELGLVLLVFPAFSCASIVEERLAKSYDLLVTTQLGAHQIALGKFMSAVVYGATFIAATFPLVAITFLYGGVSTGQILLAYASLVIVSVVVSAYGLLVSALASSAARSVVRTFLLLPAVCVFVLSPLGWLLWALVYGPLAKDYKAVQARETILALDATNTAILWAGVLAWTFTWVSLFFLLTANELKPPRADRSTPLRSWFVGSWTIAVGLFLIFVVHNQPWQPNAVVEMLTRYYPLALVGLGLGVFAFSVDAGGNSTERLPRSWRRILGADAASGGRLVLLLAGATYVAVFGAFWGVDATSLPGVRGYNAPYWILVMGGAWSLAFLLAVTQLSLLLSRLIRHATVTRIWIAFALGFLLLYPMFWYYLDDRREKGNLYKGYFASPWTVALSIYTNPGLTDRQLVLFGASGEEVLRAQDGAVRELQRRVERPTSQQLTEAKNEAARPLLEQGLSAGTVSIGFYGLLGLLCLGLNLKNRGPRAGPPTPLPEPPPLAGEEETGKENRNRNQNGNEGEDGPLTSEAVGPEERATAPATEEAAEPTPAAEHVDVPASSAPGAEEVPSGEPADTAPDTDESAAATPDAEDPADEPAAATPDAEDPANEPAAATPDAEDPAEKQPAAAAPTGEDQEDAEPGSD